MRDLSEILTLREIGCSYYAILGWEAKLLPVMGDELRRLRHGTRRGSSASMSMRRT